MLYLHVLVYIFSVIQLIVTDISIIRNKRQAKFLLNEVESYAIIVPVKVTVEGYLQGYDVRHVQRRNRRSVDDDVTIYYRLPLEDSNLTLSVKANSDLLAPGFVVESTISDWRNITSMKTKLYSRKSHHCLFEGFINGIKNSKVALTTCNGLSGLIHTGKNEFLIEPVKGHNPGNVNGHPHVIYKRSALKSHQKKGTCGVSDSLTTESNYHGDEKINLRNGANNQRSKRSVSMERYVETLVVADREMVGYYANEDIETYILTIMNMVSSLFHDASIGNAINIVIVRLMLLESEQLEKEDEQLLISQHADNTLRSFCRWQKFINPTNENHPNHHDVAILLTRYNICSRANEPCSTLGLAEVAGMCQPHRSCNVNEDTGLALAYTIAHEMGHNFGMSHDSLQNGCQAPLGEKQHVMSPHLNSDASPFVWSNCSRGEITKFLDRDWGSCLDDEPSDHEFSFPELPPGAMYDADHQCRLQYGAEAEFCEGIEDVCQTLWCRQENKCVTRLEPAAEGTLCGKNMWCHLGECTMISERPNSIDGEWGAWSSWSACSRSCGAGVQNSERYCNNPNPAYGGRFCIGERKRYKICNTEKCPENSPSFRAVQCSRFNAVPYKDELHAWLPVSTPLTPCQLHCKPDGQFFSVMLADVVQDGTECNPGTRDICINGKCRRVACDWGIDSKALEDRCGVCHGDGTQCYTIKGEFNQKTGLGYVDVVTIPKESRNIRVEEVAEATNYIAVRGKDSDFYLNGQWFIQWSGEYQGAGTRFYYQRDGEKETLQIPGPIKEKIHILLLYQTENPGLIYEYTIPNKNITRKPEFYWEYSDWTTCSETCGGGMQMLKAKCFEKEAGHVEDVYCDLSKRPIDKTRICNKHICPAKWWTGPWQHCSVTCGGNGVRQRTVICIRSLGSDEQIALHEEECMTSQRPKDVEPCHKQTPCRAKNSWDAGQWTDVCQEDPCNYQSRRVFCNNPSGDCEDGSKPAVRRRCGNVTCGNWVVGDWSQCSSSCGEGTRYRNVSCVDGVVCQRATRPSSTRKCNTRPCAGGETSHNTTEEHDFLDEFDFSDDLENWIAEDDPILLDMPPIFTQRKKPPSDKTNATLAGKPKYDRPKITAKDIVYHPKYEIENPMTENEWVKDSANSKRLPRTDPASVAYVPDDDIPTEKKYIWKVNNWSQCSDHCDGGYRSRVALCLDMVTQHLVVDSLCDIYTKPKTDDVCNTQPCLEWLVSEWSQCSVQCGDGLQQRRVYCSKSSMCNRLTRPPHSRTCTAKPCLQWVEGSWSPCSVTCGRGSQVRQVKCVNVTNHASAFGCDIQQKPHTHKTCVGDSCPSTTSELKKCKDTMDSSLCKSLLHMCSNYFFRVKCCFSCSQVHKTYIKPKKSVHSPKRKSNS